MARNATNFIIEDPSRFPSGMKALADAIHGMGLQFGLYTSATSLTCQLRPGSYEMEAEDAASYCAWGLDYIKMCVRPLLSRAPDFCNRLTPRPPPPPTLPHTLTQ